jgi:disulfide oxidoreductase YuzD
MCETKKCTGCKETYPISNFYKNKLTHDGHSNYCVSCTRENSKKYHQRKKEKEKGVKEDNFMKMVLINENIISDGNTNFRADTLMRVMMVEKYCKSIMDELGDLKKTLLKTESELVG